ncbi:hypothetical protein SDC9_201158 [bioreactor metagenome]|uniref:Uncharacterized protein n=1 Tax=bioreactor metagenome TaxID=1076179 RepID=A0A645IZ14_9ZZZZ
MKLAVDLLSTHAGLGQGVVLKDTADLPQEMGGRQQCRGRSELVEPVKKKLCVLVALGGGLCQPPLRQRLILRHLPPQQVEFAQCVLGELVALLCRVIQIFQCLRHILGDDFAPQILLAQPVPGIRTAVLVGHLQPVQPRRDVPHQPIVGEQQLAQGV